MLAVIEEGSLGKAAQRLHISQPALTKSIQRLEEHLGVRLFERDSRGMKPTLYADSLQGYAKAACAGMAEAEGRIRSLRSGTEGVIRVAAPPLIATEFLPRPLVALSDERPNLKIEVISQNKSLFTDLLEGQFNIVVAMLYDELPWEGLTKHWLFDDRLVLAMRAEHPMARRKNLRLADLLEEKWVFTAGDTWSNRRVRLYFEQSGLPLPRARMESRNPAILKAVIASSDHVGIISRLGVERELKSGALISLDLDSQMMQRPIGIVQREIEPTSPAIKSFIALMEQASAARRADTQP
jgi:DNA-binding transcriptional LysR family regulator